MLYGLATASDVLWHKAAMVCAVTMETDGKTLFGAKGVMWGKAGSYMSLTCSIPGPPIATNIYFIHVLAVCAIWKGEPWGQCGQSEGTSGETKGS